MSVRPLLQSEAAECGLACLAMVADAHGLHVDMAEMRRRFPMSLKGAKLSQLIDIAQRLGLQARALRLEPEALPQLALPCILHWDLNHFVVLSKIGRTGATVVDPAYGERRMTLAEVSRHFTGVALELTPTADFRPRPAVPAIGVRQLTGRMTGLWRSLLLIGALSLALQVFVLLAPFFLQWVIDQVLVSADADLLLVLGLGFGLTLLVQAGIGLLRGWSVVFLSSHMGMQWMGNVFAHLLRLPLDFFEKRHLGDITSRMNSLIAIQRTLSTSFVEAIIDGMMAVATLAMMLVYSAKLTAVTLVAVALYMVLRAITYRPMRQRTEQNLVASARQQTHLLESLRGMQSLKLGSGESLRRAIYGNLMVDTVNQEVWLARMGLGFATASQLIFGIERIAVICIGALLAIDNVFSVGMLVAYLAYKDQFAQRIAGLIDKWVEFRMLRLHGERLADIVLTPPEEAYAMPDAPMPASAGILVEGLSFRYADGDPWVLHDCSFQVAPGEAVAIVGASGSGKTTLVKLMLGLLTPTSGTVAVGGQDIRMLGVRNFVREVGAVMQEDQLFAGSIADNIRFFDEDIDQARIERAARLAAIHEEIAAMPMGYHTFIGDMGSTLSGGQKQRVILARALCREPRFLFLDEATSHLDIGRERLVNVGVRGLGLTMVIVAHRPETIAAADRVLTMESGRLVERPAEPSGVGSDAAREETSEMTDNASSAVNRVAEQGDAGAGDQPR